MLARRNRRQHTRVHRGQRDGNARPLGHTVSEGEKPRQEKKIKNTELPWLADEDVTVYFAKLEKEQVKLKAMKINTPKGYYSRVLVEVWNKRAWGSCKIQEDSALDLLREGMIRWCENNITRSLFRYLNRTYLEWRVNLKGFGRILWDK